MIRLDFTSTRPKQKVKHMYRFVQTFHIIGHKTLHTLKYWKQYTWARRFMISVIFMYAILTFVVMESHLVSYQTSDLDTSMCMSNKRTKHGFSWIELILSIVLSSFFDNQSDLSDRSYFLGLRQGIPWTLMSSYVSLKWERRG